MDSGRFECDSQTALLARRRQMFSDSCRDLLSKSRSPSKIYNVPMIFEASTQTGVHLQNASTQTTAPNSEQANVVLEETLSTRCPILWGLLNRDD